MPDATSERLLSRLSEAIAARMGLHFPRERWPDLERGIRAAARESGFQDVEAYGRWLLSSALTRQQIEALAGHLAVGETYFFRERPALERLERYILPRLIRSRRGSDQRLRLWSAGCCTGEEPYSVAILLSQLIPDWPDWNITILATDIDPRFLQKAAAGVYGEWSFRDTPPWVKERYFTRTPAGRFEIVPSVRRMVTLAYLNLAEDAYPSLLNNTNGMDVILCRNVLMYFTPERAKQVAHNLHCALVDGGWLIVSPSEASPVLFSDFLPVHFPGTVLYRKDGPVAPVGGDSAPRAMPGRPTPEVMPGPDLAPPIPGCPPKLRPEHVSTRTRGAGVKGKSRATPEREAFALYEQGRYAEAEAKVIGLLSQKPGQADALALLARLYANQGKLAEARAACERAIASDRLNPASHFLCATIQEEQGQIEDAVQSLRRALYLDPNFVLAHFALGNLALRQGSFQESDKHFENSLALLGAYGREDRLPHADGLTAGRLAEIIRSTVYREIASRREDLS